MPTPALLPSVRMPEEIVPYRTEEEMPEMETSMSLPAVPSQTEATPDALAGIGGALRAWQYKGSLRRWREVLGTEVDTLKVFVTQLKKAQLRKARERVERG